MTPSKLKGSSGSEAVGADTEVFPISFGRSDASFGIPFGTNGSDWMGSEGLFSNKAQPQMAKFPQKANFQHTEKVNLFKIVS